MSEIADPTSWTDREREFFALGWNECIKMQPGGSMKVFVVMGNSYPEAVFTSDGAAQKFINEQRQSESSEIGKRFGPTIYWRFYEFELHRERK